MKRANIPAFTRASCISSVSISSTPVEAPILGEDRFAAKAKLQPAGRRFSFYSQFLLKALITFVLLFLLGQPLANGQQATGSELQKLTQQAHRDAQQYVDLIVPKLFANLPPHDLEIYRQIRTNLTDNNNAWQTQGGIDNVGDRYINIDVGYIRKLEMFAEAVRLEESTGREVLVPYIAYVAHSLNAKQTYIKSPAVFIGMSLKEIDELDEVTPAKKQEIAMILNSVAFILAHEVGHHVLGHHDHPTNDLAKLRQMESEADDWALDRCVKAHFSPLGGMLPVIFEYYTTAHALENEQKNDHPADLRRLHAIYAAMLNSLPAFRSDIEAQGASYSAFRDAIKRKLDEYEWQLSSGQPVAYDSSVSKFDACMQRRIKSCMDDCINNYNYSVKECGTRLCNPDKGSNVAWAGRCRRLTK